jgi:hypothetical protein
MKKSSEGKGIKEFKVRKMPKYILKDITKLQKIMDKVVGQKPTGIFAEKEEVNTINLHLEHNKWKVNN